MSHESLSHESSYESSQRFCLEPFQDGGLG